MATIVETSNVQDEYLALRDDEFYVMVYSHQNQTDAPPHAFKGASVAHIWLTGWYVWNMLSFNGEGIVQKAASLPKNWFFS
jgi:hypothetical protein